MKLRTALLRLLIIASSVVDRKESLVYCPMYGSAWFTHSDSGGNPQHNPAETYYVNQYTSCNMAESPNVATNMNVSGDVMTPMHPTRVYSSFGTPVLILEPIPFAAPRLAPEAIDESHGLRRSSRNSSTRLRSDTHPTRRSLRSSTSRSLRRSTSSNLPEEDMSQGDYDYGGYRGLKRNFSRRKVEDDIWSEDVQAAFEEGLAIAPKQGPYKIKVDNKIIGRNGLISAYILDKTGKLRSRKQVSSHIQVVKNLGQNEALIDLINNGPKLETLEEQEQHNAKVIEIFEQVFKDKSVDIRASEEKSSSPTTSNAHLTDISMDYTVSNFEFFIQSPEFGSICLTSQIDIPATESIIPSIVSVFPGIEMHFQYPAPIIYNQVRLCPNLYIQGSELHTRYQVNHPTGGDTHLNCFTSVMSMGHEVLRIHEKGFDLNLRKAFLPTFWGCLFQKSNQLAASLVLIFQGITIKQVLYEPLNECDKFISRSSVKAVLLWDFTVVDRIEDAVTISRAELPYMEFSHGEHFGLDHSLVKNEAESQAMKNLDLIPTGLPAVPGGIESDMPLENAAKQTLSFFQVVPSSQYWIPPHAMYGADTNHPSVNVDLAHGNNDYPRRNNL